VTVYPEPHVPPVLPNGWAPLAQEEEASLLEACDANPGQCRLRLGSLWDPNAEYRVYCLDDERWRGICAATLFDLGQSASDKGRNTRLLAVARTAQDAVRIAVDFLNWDLEADGADWRLGVKSAPPA
jgi:hypothetical protein